MSTQKVERVNDNRKQFHSLLKRSHDIKMYRNRIDLIIHQKDDGTGQKFHMLEQLAENSNKVLTTEKNHLAEMLKKVELIISSRNNLSSTPDSLPDVEKIRSETQTFTETSILKVVPAPYPPLCGALPLASDQLIPKGSFVCIQNQSDYILAIVLGFDPETFKYSVCDAAPEGDEVVSIEIEAFKVIPLPTTVPARRSKATTYQINSRVLALWPDENNSWTSVFYFATVMTQPNNSPGL